MLAAAAALCILETGESAPQMPVVGWKIQDTARFPPPFLAHLCWDGWILSIVPSPTAATAKQADCARSH